MCSLDLPRHHQKMPYGCDQEKTRPQATLSNEPSPYLLRAPNAYSPKPSHRDLVVKKGPTNLIPSLNRLGLYSFRAFKKMDLPVVPFPNINHLLPKTPNRQNQTEK